MKRFLLITSGWLLVLLVQGQDPQQTRDAKADKYNLELRPNSREYAAVFKDNNHQRVIQFRKMAQIRHSRSMMNKQKMMQQHRKLMNQQKMRQQRIRRQMIQRRQRMQGR